MWSLLPAGVRPMGLGRRGEVKRAPYLDLGRRLMKGLPGGLAKPAPVMAALKPLGPTFETMEPDPSEIQYQIFYIIRK